MKRIADAIVIAGLMAVVIMASGCANTKLVPVCRDGSWAIAYMSDSADKALAMAADAAQNDPDKQIVRLEEVDVPLTGWQKFWRALGTAGGGVGTALIGANNEWFRFEHKDQSEDVPAQVYNISGNEQVNVANGNGGNVDQKNEDNDTAE